MPMPNISDTFQEGRGYVQKDWNDVSSSELTDDQIAALRPFAEVLPDIAAKMQDAIRSRGRPTLERPKEAISIRLDADTLARIRATGKGWQSRINEALAKAFPG